MAQEKMQDVNKQAMEWLRDIPFNTVQIVDQAETLKTRRATRAPVIERHTSSSC